MVAKRFQDLEAWQLAREVKRQVFALTEAGPVMKDFEFRDQIRASAASAPRNIAEGFGRYRPAEFANKTRIALGELRETESSLPDGADRGYFRAAEVGRVQKLIDRASKVTSRLHSYLESCAQQRLYSPRRKRAHKKERRTTKGGQRTQIDERENDER